MTGLDVTIVVVPRERYSATERSLSNLYDNTPQPFELVYVSAGAPASVQRYLEAASKEKRFRLITTGYLSPNQARNLALPYVSTKYVVYLDNDALVAEGWLARLVQCAEETGAAIVGPLYLIGEIEQRTIHMAGGRLHYEQIDGKRFVYDEHCLCDRRVDALTVPLQRSECDFVEFHCMLLRTGFLRQLGSLDEGLFSVHEHIDVGLEARKAGLSVYFEPAAVASYVPPPPFDWSDLPYFMLRWCDDWSTASVERFQQKWNVGATRHFGDPDNSVDIEDTAVRFGRAHRRRTTGMRVPGDRAGTPLSANDQACLMIALFQSVDRDAFDLALTNADDIEVDAHIGLSAAATLARLPDILRNAENAQLNVRIRPRPPRRSNEPALVRLDVDAQALPDVEHYGFLILKADANRYEVWLAVDRSSWRSAALLRRLTGESLATGTSSRLSGVAGSQAFRSGSDASGPARVTLHSGIAGGITTAMDLSDGLAQAHLWSSSIW
ncbi:MAG: glycosyltransferase [Betaproteobacteria bacterium]